MRERLLKWRLWRPRARGAGSLGQSMVEFALIVPMFTLLVFGLIDLGRDIYIQEEITNAAREGARFAAISSLCTDNSISGCSDPSNVVWHVVNESSGLGLVGGSAGNIQVSAINGGTTYCGYGPCTPNYTTYASNAVAGSVIKVKLTYTFTVLTPVIGQIVGNSINLSSTAVMVVE
jgi:Flp pilus assembly protein TadG